MTESKKVIEDVPCTFCGCLCDDIVLEVEAGKITSMKNGCTISKSRFLNHHDNRMEYPTVLKDGKQTQVDMDTAIAKAVEIISSAKRVLVYGLSSTENDAHREAYKIAELAGGVVDNTSSVCHGPTILGVQESGEAAASLAEVRHRSDLVIYWGSNPTQAHPRHVDRFIRVPGEYVKDPKAGRQIWVVDVRQSESKRIADKFIQFNPGSDLEILSALRALVRGHRVAGSEIGGIPVE